MSDSNFDPELLAPTAAMLRADIAISAAIEKRAVEPLGLEADLADLLVRLATAPEGHLRGVDIASQLMANPARVSRLLDRAEKQELVERQPDPDDRRAQRIVLTKEGEEMTSRLAPLLSSVLEDVTATLSRDEKLALIELLQKVESAARSAAETDSSS